MEAIGRGDTQKRLDGIMVLSTVLGTDRKRPKIPCGRKRVRVEGTFQRRKCGNGLTAKDQAPGPEPQSRLYRWG